MKVDIVIVGGAGHIGLPLGLLFANKGKKVVLYDKDKKNIEKINKLQMPFMEDGGKFFLVKNKKRIIATTNKKFISMAKIIIICIGTPVKKSKPDLIYFFKMFKELRSYIKPEKLLIIRSSIYPGTCYKIQKFLGKKFKNISYCPERVVQGKSIIELPKLPQIISGISKSSIIKSDKLFKLIFKKTIITSILEAELIKLFSNAWRYINFSISNQFYMICNNFDINFKNLRKNMIDGYERNKGIPHAGFTAGPCLYKDTAQLNAFLKNSFTLGSAATEINQGFPKFIYKKLNKKFKGSLKNKKIGILGAAFKSNIDDTRDSISIDLYNLQSFKHLKSREYSRAELVFFSFSSESLSSVSCNCIIISIAHRS